MTTWPRFPRHYRVCRLLFLREFRARRKRGIFFSFFFYITSCLWEKKQPHNHFPVRKTSNIGFHRYRSFRTDSFIAIFFMDTRWLTKQLHRNLKYLTGKDFRFIKRLFLKTDRSELTPLSQFSSWTHVDSQNSFIETWNIWQVRIFVL